MGSYMLDLNYYPEKASLPHPLPHHLPGCVPPSPCALLSWALYRAELHSYSKAVTALLWMNSHMWMRDLPAPLVAAAGNCCTELTVAVFNPSGEGGSRQRTCTRFQEALIASSVHGLYSLQSARAQTLFPACSAAALPQHTATERSGLPSILL